MKNTTTRHSLNGPLTVEEHNGNVSIKQSKKSSERRKQIHLNLRE